MCASEREMESPGEEAGRSAAPATNGSNKIIGRNVNGTMVVTSRPSNEAELQLYRVMQRASLLAYYDTLLEMGGDDVQQLCDAGEEEFLEIMALVGMASKPLHVRRLQKALQEWVNNPALFQIPIVPLCPTENPFVCNQRLLNMPTLPSLPRTVSSPESRPMYSPSPGAPENSCGSTASQPNASPVHTNNFTKIVLPSSPAAAPVTTTASRSFSPQSACPPSAGSSPSSVTSPVQLTPVLLDVHVQKLAAAAEKLSKHLPQLEPKPQNTKKKMCKDLELVMMMPEADPRRMEEIRKYAAIYGRFDCKRKPEKPLTLHEVMVNEAAAQMCRCVPALLTRRDELFPLARQLVRRAGLHYSKHGLPPTAAGNEEAEDDATAAKRPRQDGEEGNGIRASPDAARSNSNHREENGDYVCMEKRPSPFLLKDSDVNVDALRKQIRQVFKLARRGSMKGEPAGTPDAASELKLCTPKVTRLESELPEPSKLVGREGRERRRGLTLFLLKHQYTTTGRRRKTTSGSRTRRQHHSCSESGTPTTATTTPCEEPL